MALLKIRFFEGIRQVKSYLESRFQRKTIISNKNVSGNENVLSQMLIKLEKCDILNLS